MKIENLIFIYPILLLGTELLIKYEKYTYSFIFTILWVLFYIFLMIKESKTNYDSVFIRVKKFLNVLLALPVLRLIILSFPFNFGYLSNITITYLIFAAITIMYVMNYRLHFIDIGHHFRKIIYLIPGLILMALIAYANYRFLDYESFTINPYSIFFIIISSYTMALYFQGLVQNFSHEVIKNQYFIVYGAIIQAILSLHFHYISIITIFLSALIINAIFMKTKNLTVSFLLYLTSYSIQYLLLPNFSILNL